MSKPKLIVLTGATRGLGLAMTEAFVAAGHQVVGCGRDSISIQQLNGRHPHCDFSTVDLTDEHQVSNWATQTLEQQGTPDLLINNAAMINANAPLWQVSESEFAEVMEININAVHRTIRHFCPAMIERGSGVIINFSSGWGRSASANVAPYCASKWAIEGLTKALAEDLPAGIGAVALNPGVIHTDMLNSCFGADAASFEKPANWASTAAPYLLSLTNKNNGQSLSAP